MTFQVPGLMGRWTSSPRTRWRRNIVPSDSTARPVAVSTQRVVRDISASFYPVGVLTSGALRAALAGHADPAGPLDVEPQLAAVQRARGDQEVPGPPPGVPQERPAVVWQPARKLRR